MRAAGSSWHDRFNYTEVQIVACFSQSFRFILVCARKLIICLNFSKKKYSWKCPENLNKLISTIWKLPNMAEEKLLFCPNASQIDSTFWGRFCKLKLEVLGLNEDPLPVSGQYGPNEIPNLNPILSVDHTSFDA